MRCERRGCSKTFVPHKKASKTGPNRRRFCSPSCRRQEYLYRSGKRKPRQYGLCKNGHERTPENTLVTTTRQGYVTKNCRVCNRERCRKQYEEHGEEMRARMRSYHQKHAERINARARTRRRQRAIEKWQVAA
jgi:hypothetical protein